MEFCETRVPTLKIGHVAHTLKDVSIILVTYKGDELTKCCLDSLKSTCGQDPQIIVVDNSPSETTRLIVASHPNAVYVPSPGNPGFAGGNNRALPFCNRDYILLLNNDTIVHSRASIEQLVAFLDKNPKCGAAQGSGRLPREGNTLAGCGSFLMPIGFMWSPGFNKKSNPHDRTHSCFAVSGFFMMFRRSIIKEVGGFLFRSHFWCYYEETDFCHRVWLSGNEIWYVKTPPIDHLCGATSNQFKHSDIMARHLKNLLFSLNANLSFWSRLKILSLCKALLFIHSILHLCKGHRDVFKSDWNALIRSRNEKARTLVARRQAKRMRKATDRQIFKTILRRPPATELLKYFSSNA